MINTHKRVQARNKVRIKFHHRNKVRLIFQVRRILVKRFNSASVCEMLLHEFSLSLSLSLSPRSHYCNIYL